jgi:hypothetical protein
MAEYANYLLAPKLLLADSCIFEHAGTLNGAGISMVIVGECGYHIMAALVQVDCAGPSQVQLAPVNHCQATPTRLQRPGVDM